MNTNIHIIKKGSKWAIRKEGSLRAYKLCSTKPRAIFVAFCSPLWMTSPYTTRMIVHKENGYVEDILEI